MIQKPVLWYRLRQVVFITIAWVIIGVLVELYNSVNYDPEGNRHFVWFLFGNGAAEHLLITAIGPLMGGLVGGSFIVFFQREKLKGKTYFQKLLIHSLLYVLFVVLCILIVGLIGALFNKNDGSYWVKFKKDVFSLRVYRLLIAWYFIVIFTFFILDVSERYGAATLKRLLLGKYHAPGKEHRIFMFLDLKSSTAMAERIGDELYFRMLRYFYQVANEAIMQANGEIYQYVGDEIVISWEKDTGLKNANCIRCFDIIREAVQKRRAYFLDNFTVVPDFKAGVHSGIVATGEIGLVKKDIVYSGDVLNTTARIIALCNHYRQDMIISETLYQQLKDTPGYRFTYLDSPLLKGKAAPFAIFGVKALS